jgi:hypothetical protein
MMIHKMVSADPITEYAPTWNFSFGSAHWSDADAKIDSIKNWLVSNEQRIIEQYPLYFDGGTGLGNNSVTSRFGQYNLFKFVDELSELNDLLDFFRKSYIDFIKEEKGIIRDTEIVCWFNVIRNSQNIKEHHHGAGHDVYLSGNFMLDNYDTYTVYKCPFDTNVFVPVANRKGTVTIFPTCLPHVSTPFEGDDVRVSIGFDIRLAGILDIDDLNAVPFINSKELA